MDNNYMKLGVNMGVRFVVVVFVDKTAVVLASEPLTLEVKFPLVKMEIVTLAFEALNYVEP